MVRISGLMVFAPLFSSTAIAPRIKAGFVIAMTVLLAPWWERCRTRAWSWTWLGCWESWQWG